LRGVAQLTMARKTAKKGPGPEERRQRVALAAIALPKPAFHDSRRLYKALRRRRTIREIGPGALPLKTLSNLLWAACGVNRKLGPFGLDGRTAASASNSREVEVYVALQAGVYRYEPFAHQLEPVVEGDLRRLAIGRGQSRSGDKAPVRLVYVADVDKLVHTCGFQEPGLRDPDVQRSYYFVDTGMIAANVYLFAASEGLAAWFHNCDKAALHERLGLREDQRVLFGQTVGLRMKPAGKKPAGKQRARNPAGG
jgi:nitroreductase